jgi:hypothetical protein
MQPILSLVTEHGTRRPTHPATGNGYPPLLTPITIPKNHDAPFITRFETQNPKCSTSARKSYMIAPFGIGKGSGVPSRVRIYRARVTIEVNPV